MEFHKVQALRGPNVWANFPVLEAWVDLGPYKDLSSDEQPGFNERLMAWLPSLIEHRCSVGERGGFFERLRRGTYPAHILEHVCLELQCLAGTEVGFGRARAAATDGLYKVAIEYENERLARAALEAARRLCLAAIHDQPFDVAAEIEVLRGIYRETAPTAETAVLLKAARKRRIPARLLSDQGLIQLGHGAKQRRLQGARTDRTSAIAESVARDNHLTRTLLRSVGVPVPEGETVDSAEAAWQAAEDMEAPVSVRPRYGSERRPSWTRLEGKEQVTAAYQEAADGDPVIVERCLPGLLHRLLVVNGRVAAALRCGEGALSDATPQLHPETAACARDAAAVVGLDVAAVEVVTTDITLPLEGNGAVLAVRARPALDDFLGPSGEPQPAAEAILATLFPEGDNGRIPVVSITGTNGKTTTTRLIAHIFGRVYSPVGLTCSEGIYVGGREIEQGDCSGPNSARMVLQHPDVRAAVLETARGGILREGLGFDRCLVAVVTNLGRGDHLGLNDVHTPEQAAKVKRTPVDVVLREGAAVLNAADPLVAAMAEHCPGEVIYFARGGEHPEIVKHRAAGKRAVFDRGGMLVLAQSERENPLIALDRIPMTHGGRVGFNVENALAAAAACWAAGIPLNEIRAGLKSFGSVLDQVPCRFNLLDYHGATVVLDYAHNISALSSFLEVVETTFPHPTRSCVYAVPGDRGDDVIIEQGEMLGRAYDRVVIYEDTELRGRPEGTIFALIREGLARGGRTREVVEVRGNLKAIEKALELVCPGELLVIQPEFPSAGADFFRRLMNGGAREVSLGQACARCPAAGREWAAVGSEDEAQACPALTNDW